MIFHITIKHDVQPTVWLRWLTEVIGFCLEEEKKPSLFNNFYCEVYSFISLLRPVEDNSFFFYKKIFFQRMDSQESCVLAVGHSFAFFINNMKKSGVSLKDWPAYESAVHDLGKILLFFRKAFHWYDLISSYPMQCLETWAFLYRWD